MQVEQDGKLILCGCLNLDRRLPEPLVEGDVEKASLTHRGGIDLKLYLLFFGHCDFNLWNGEVVIELDRFSLCDCQLFAAFTNRFIVIVDSKIESEAALFSTRTGILNLDGDGTRDCRLTCFF